MTNARKFIFAGLYSGIYVKCAIKLLLGNKNDCCRHVNSANHRNKLIDLPSNTEFIQDITVTGKGAEECSHNVTK